MERVMKYEIIVCTKGFSLLKLTDEFYGLEEAKKRARTLYHELKDVIENVQIRATGTQHVLTLGDDAIWF